MDLVMLLWLSTVLQAGGGGGGADAGLAAGLLIFLIILYGLLFIASMVVIAGMWATFTKAGQPGWAAIIPIYNTIVLLEITGKPIWWFFVMICCLPVGVILHIIVMVELAARFGKGGGFAVGLILLPYIFVPILGFGDARYSPPERDYGYEDRPRRRRPPRDEYDEDEDRPRRPRRPRDEDEE